MQLKCLLDDSLALFEGFKSCHGMELLSSLYKESRKILHLQYNGQCKVHFEHGDFTKNLSWLTYDVIFTNSACFTIELQEKLRTLSKRLKPGCRFVTVGFQLLMPETFLVLHDDDYAMSWGVCRVYIHVRI